MVKTNSFKKFIRPIIITVAIAALICTLLFFLTTPIHTSFPLTHKEISLLVRQGEQGDRDSCWILAAHFEEYKKEYLYWLRKGSSYGDPRAQDGLYNYYITQRDPQLIKEALDQLNKSAAQNFASAQVELGVLYRDGDVVASRGRDIVTKDQKQAEYWFRKAAKNGYISAMEFLLELLITNHNDKASLTEAYKWSKILIIRNTDAYEQQKEINEKASKLGFDTVSLRLEAESLAIKEEKQIPQVTDPVKEVNMLIANMRRNWQKE